MLGIAGFAFFLTLISACMAFATQPLITDDVWTQGKGKIQLEVSFEHDRDDHDAVVDYTNQFEAILTYGMLDDVDLVITIPSQFISTVSHAGRQRSAGISDVLLEGKWRFYEMNGLAFAIKPGIVIPSGNEDQGFGTGQVGGQIFLIATRVADPWAFHMNVGYQRNENTVDENTNLWHVSLASELRLCQWLKAVANVGMERDTDKHSGAPPAFILGGFVFPVNAKLDLDIGVKGGLTRSESDYSLLAGITMRF
jgi:hypothetical protein